MNHTTTYFRAKAFSQFPVDHYRCMVCEDGDVRVFDDLAGYYTDHHVLSDDAKSKIRSQAVAKLRESASSQETLDGIENLRLAVEARPSVDLNRWLASAIRVREAMLTLADAIESAS